MKLSTIESLKATIPVGSPCQVHAFGCWYDGTLVSYGRTLAEVAFTTSGGPRTKKAAAPLVVPAGTYKAGVRGEPEPKTASQVKLALARVKAVYGGQTVGFTHAQAVEEAQFVGAEEHEIAEAIASAPGAVK